LTIETTEDGHIRLIGMCRIEDAEPLLRLLSGDPQTVVDWRSCRSIHTSVLQVLLAARAKMMGPPDDNFLRMSLEPLMNASG
jgi:hypothetical protein